MKRGLLRRLSSRNEFGSKQGRFNIEKFNSNLLKIFFNFFSKKLHISGLNKKTNFIDLIVKIIIQIY